jgi:hypothetical protein
MCEAIDPLLRSEPLPTVVPLGTILIGKLIVVVLRQHQKGESDRARKSKRGAIPRCPCVRSKVGLRSIWRSKSPTRNPFVFSAAACK